jgi:diacylglycerol kinase family enzyme
MRKVGVIIDCAAGTSAGSELSDKVRELFEKHGCSPRLELATGAFLGQAARAMRDEGYDVIVAGGGDGTISTVAAQIAGSATALGVLPLGTLNHFARDAGIPLDIDEAVETVCTGEVKAVDVASVNERVFINNSSLGLYPDQARLRQFWRARIGRWPALLVASLVVLVRFPFVRLIAEFNGQRVSRRCPMMLVGNNEYKLQPGRLTERERLNGGTLGIYLLREAGRVGLIRIALHSLVFSVEEAASFESYSAPELVIRTRRRRIRVALDGEVYRFKTPLYYRALPGSLRVIVPKAVVGGQGSVAGGK